MTVVQYFGIRQSYFEGSLVGRAVIEGARLRDR